MSNMFKTAMLLAVLTAMLVLIGGAIGGQQGMLVAFVIALVMNFFATGSPTRSCSPCTAPADRRSLGARALRDGPPARHARRHPDAAGLHDPHRDAQCLRHRPQPAARRVAVTEGIMRILDEEELEGVLAHELAHVDNRDVLISTIAATLAGAITYLAHMAQWAAMFGGHRRDDDEGGGEPDRGDHDGDPRPDRRHARADGGVARPSSRPTPPAPASPASPGASPRPWRSCRWRTSRADAAPPRRPPTCSS